MDRPELVAHRGFAARCPENTRAAIQAAIEAGARFVEVDVQLSSDGVPYLFHDRTLQRVCGRPGGVHEFTARELDTYRASERGRFGRTFAEEPLAKLATLVEVLQPRPDVFAFVELKRNAIERFGSARVLEVVLRELEPLTARCALISFDLAALHAARAMCKLPLGAVFDHWREIDTPALRELAPEYVFTDVHGLPARTELVLPCGELAVYEVAEPALAFDLARRGARYIETFEVAKMLKALQNDAP
jgi:glycerophosphoryl diester phosphodiesterase